MNKGDFVEIEYVGTIKETGEIFDLTDEKLARDKGMFNPQTRYGPVDIVVGAPHVLPGLDKRIAELKVGDKKTIELKPEDAFGQRHAELMKMFSANAFKKQNINPVPGQFIDIGQARGKVLSVSGGRIRIDFNHPLAGKTLIYDVKVNRKIEKKDEQVRALVGYHLPIKLEAVDVAIKGDDCKIKLPLKQEMPAQLKNSIAEEITKHVKGLKTIEFSAVFEKEKKDKK